MLKSDARRRKLSPVERDVGRGQRAEAALAKADTMRRDLRVMVKTLEARATLSVGLSFAPFYREVRG